MRIPKAFLLSFGIVVFSGTVVAFVSHFGFKPPMFELVKQNQVATISISMWEIDFGRVEISRSIRRSVMLTNTGKERIRLENIDISGPFYLSQAVRVLPAGESRNFSVSFRPRQEGGARGKLVFEVETQGGRSRLFEILLLGAGGSAADLPLRGKRIKGEIVVRNTASESSPRPPGESQPAGKEGGSEGFHGPGEEEKETPGEVALGVVDEWIGVENPQFPELEPELSGGTGISDSPTGSTVSHGQENVLPGLAFAVNQAFFDLHSEDGNREPEPLKPVRFPAREPDFSEERGEETPESDDADPPIDSDPSSDQEKEDGETSTQPVLRIASNSFLSLNGELRSFPSQVLSLNAVESEGGIEFRFTDRFVFPVIITAFDQFVELVQWGNATGSLDGSGHLRFSMTVRLTDSDGGVADMPLELTTGQVVGQTTSQTGVFLSGKPLNESTGEFELVGIQAVPAGFQSIVESKPVIFSVLGRLENL